MISPNISLPPIKIYLNVQEKNDKPAVELRCLTTNEGLMKVLVSAAWNKTPIALSPEFKDPIKSLAALKEKGIVYEDKETGEIKFSF